MMRPGDRLPSIALERTEGDGAVNLRHGGRDATVIVKLPAAGSARFRRYLERLADALPAFRDWDGRLLAIVDERSEIASIPFPVLRDDPGATRDWGSADDATVIVADRFGVVYHEAHGRGAADLPPTGAIVEWLRFLATQCPECGVPDEPGLGEYA